MTFLPILRRELRTASRRTMTTRLRWWAALLALALSLLVLAGSILSRTTRAAGNPLFGFQSGYAMVLCLLFGVLLTADSLARERREGTLGFLMLSGLSGSDVVLGKFFANSLNGFYCLLAILPAGALSFVMGGVGGGEYVRMALCLLNALFFALAAGTLVSALSRESHNSMGNGIGLVLLLVAVLPGAAAAFRWVGLASIWQTVAWFSPAFTYMHATGLPYLSSGREFWASLVLCHLLGWCFLSIASLVLPRSFMDKPVRASSPRLQKLARKQSHESGELLTRDPVLWLRRSELGTPRAAWGLVIAWGLVAIGVWLMAGSTEFPMLQVHSAVPFVFLIKLQFALDTCRFLVEARRNGTLELLLCTPLSDQDIIRGHMKAMWRTYAAPVITVAVIMLVPIAARTAMDAIHSGPKLAEGAAGAFFAGVFWVRFVGDVFAILWVGTAVALTSKRPNLASAWTVLLVLVLPSPLSFCWVDLLLDLVFISWGTNRCRLDLRRLMTEQYQTAPIPSGVPGLPVWRF